MTKKINIELSPELSFALSKAFLRFSSLLGKFRHDYWGKLNEQERKQLEDMQWTLFNASSDLNARAVILKTELIGDDLAKLEKATEEMTKVTDKIKDIKRAIIIATKAIALGGAIASGCVPAIVVTSTELLAEIGS